jgi:hypothetical protein
MVFVTIFLFTMCFTPFQAKSRGTKLKKTHEYKNLWGKQKHDPCLSKYKIRYKKIICQVDFNKAAGPQDQMAI